MTRRSVAVVAAACCPQPKGQGLQDSSGGRLANHAPPLANPEPYLLPNRRA